MGFGGGVPARLWGVQVWTCKQLGPWGRGCLGRGRDSLRVLQGNGWQNRMTELGDKV